MLTGIRNSKLCQKMITVFYLLEYNEQFDRIQLKTKQLKILKNQWKRTDTLKNELY